MKKTNLNPAGQPGKHAMVRRYARTICVCLAILLGLTPGCRKQENAQPETANPSGKTIQASLSSGNLWYDKFVAYETAVGGAYYNSTTDAGTLGWAESYMLRSYVTMYELTKDTAWLDKLTTHVDVIIAGATDLGGDGYLDWGSPSYSSGTYPYLVFDGLIGLPIAQFIRLVHQNPTTLSAYSTQATAYRSFIETEIVPKWGTSASYVGNCWVQLSSSTGYYKEPTAFDSLPGAVFNPLPYNMQAPWAEMLWTMYEVNGYTSYRDRANSVVQYFKNGLTANGTGYKWWYCNIASPHIEDTGHGNLDIEMAIECFNRGGTIGGTQITGLTNTFINNMWNQSASTPKVKDKVDGTGTTYADTKLLNGWVRLAQFNGTAWDIAAEQFRSIAPTSFNHAFLITQIMAWDPVKVTNQGFEYESASDLTLPARWVRSGGTSSNIRRYTADKSSGKACVAITSADGDGSWQMLYQDWKQWEANTTYEITFDIKTSGANGARIFMHNNTAGAVLGTVHDYPSSPSWSTQSFTFTTPAATGPLLRVYLENSLVSTAGTAYFDNVVIKKVGDSW